MNYEPESDPLSRQVFPSRETQAPAFLWTRILAAIEAQEARLAQNWWFQWRWMSHVATATAVVVTITAGWIFYDNAQGSLDRLLHGIIPATGSPAAGGYAFDHRSGQRRDRGGHMDSKLKAGAVLVLMFGLGVVSGIAWQMHAYRHGMHAWGNHSERRIARMKKELQLTPDQEQSVRQIIEDARKRAQGVQTSVEQTMGQIHKDSVTAIDKILTPEQKPKFQKMRERHHRHPFFAIQDSTNTAPSPAKSDVK